MSKILLQLIFILGLNSIVSAQQYAFECTSEYNNTDASKLIDVVQKKYISLKALQASFSQSSYLAAVDTAESSSGKVWLEKPSKMKWLYESPESQTFLMNDKTLWYFQPEDNQVVIQNFSDVALTDLPVAFLIGMGDLRSDFILNSACRGSNGIILKLRPKDDKDIKEGLEGFMLLVDPTTEFPVGAQILHVGGNITTILLENVSYPSKIESKVFEAAFPKGMDINDLRKNIK